MLTEMRSLDAKQLSVLGDELSARQLFRAAEEAYSQAIVSEIFTGMRLIKRTSLSEPPQNSSFTFVF